VLVENAPGVLTRVAGLFARRGSISTVLRVGRTGQKRRIPDDDCGPKATNPLIEQVTKQLHKLIDVIKISDITQDEVRRTASSSW